MGESAACPGVRRHGGPGIQGSPASITVISAITVLPAVLAGLYARRLLTALGLALAADAAVVLGFVALILQSGRSDWEVAIAMPALAGGFFVTQTASLLIARRIGYRLLWGRG